MSAQVRLNIADIIIALEFDDPAVAALVGEFYGGFVTAGPVDSVVRVTWDGDVTDQWLPSPATRPRVIVDGDIYYADSELYTCEVNLTSYSGTSRVRGLPGTHGLLWSVACALLSEQNGLVVHAASVEDQGKTYVFPAASGTGKSTLVRNSPGRRILSDEGTLLRRVHGQIYAYGSPFRSDSFEDYGYSRFPVVGLYFLKQAPYDQLWTIPPIEALERLLIQTFVYADTPRHRALGLACAHTLVQMVPSHILELRNSPDFWRCLKGED